MTPDLQPYLIRYSIFLPGQVRLRWHPAAADEEPDNPDADVTVAISADQAAAAATAAASSSANGAANGADGDSASNGAGRYVIGPGGLDSAEFLMAAGPAEPLRPLSAVASGGESARVLLALKAAPALAVARRATSSSSAAAAPAVASSTNLEAAAATSSPNRSSGSAVAGVSGVAGPLPAVAGTPVLLLDELDSGIGSRLGSSVGALLARMCSPAGGGATGQILCVTHLPQVRGRQCLHMWLLVLLKMPCACSKHCGAPGLFNWNSVEQRDVTDHVRHAAGARGTALMGICLLQIANGLKR